MSKTNLSNPHSLLGSPGPKTESTAAVRVRSCNSTDEKTKAVNIRDVPAWVWVRARQNALASRMSFQEYVTMLLADSEPYPTAASQ